MLTLNVKLRHPPYYFKNRPCNAILGAWERTVQTLIALVGVEIG
jgi:hypothetical protein